ncbi:MAG: APC family permease [Candidatus Diapherotrites archaeon]|nr:APC family permease [Candidatus Diapherotrites archaeon]
MIFLLHPSSIRESKPHLTRSISLTEAVIYGLGIIIGAGVYALIGEAAGIAGNSMWISFVIAAVVASFTALSYCELSSLLPKNAAEYHYVKHAFNSETLGFLVGWVALCTLLISAAAVSIGFAGYFSSLFGTPIVLTALCLLIALAFINFFGIQLSAEVNAVLTIVAIVGLLIIIAIGLPFFGSVDYFSSVKPMVTFADFMNPIAIAAALIFFAYVGFENIAHMSEETVHARTVVPKAIQISLTISAILYILVAISAVSVVPWQQLAESSAPLALVAGTVFGGNASLLLSFIALFATSSTALVIMIGASRILGGIAADHGLPKFISRLHGKTQTPYVAIAITTVGAMLCVTLGNLKEIVFITDFGIFIIFFAVNWSTIAMRYTEPYAKRAFRLSANIGRVPVASVFGAGFSLYMLANVNAKAVMTGLPIFCLGVLLYLLLHFSRKKRLAAGATKKAKPGGKRWQYKE